MARSVSAQGLLRHAQCVLSACSVMLSEYPSFVQLHLDQTRKRRPHRAIYFVMGSALAIIGLHSFCRGSHIAEICVIFIIGGKEGGESYQIQDNLVKVPYLLMYRGVPSSHSQLYKGTTSP